MDGDSIHMHHLFYPRVLEQTTVAHILPLCEKCHKSTHAQTLFHPTVFDESKCAEKRRETIVFLQGRESARVQLARKRYNGQMPKKLSPAKLQENLDRWQPLRPRFKKTRNFLSYAEYQQRLPDPWA
jgi:hypothetical protein